MANIEKKQSEIEKAYNLAYETFRNNLIAISNVRDLKVEVEVTGVKLSTLAIMVEESEELELDVYNNCGIDNNETHTDVKVGSVTLTNIKTY